MRAVGRRTLVDLFWAAVYLAMAGAVLSIVPAVGRCEASRPMLLDFYSDWCGPCQAMRSTVDALEAAGYPVERVNIDENPARSEQFAVTGIPCFVAVVDGREVDRVVGAAPYERLEAMLKSSARLEAGIKTGGRPAAAWRYEAAVRHRSAVVRIYCQGGTGIAGGTRSIGSGTLVKWNGRLVVLTARHVVKGCEKIVVELCNGRRHAAKVMKCDAVWDCAVLELSGEPQGVEAAELELGGDAMQREGDRLESCGYGADGRLACSSGLFLGYKRSAAALRGPDDWLALSGHARCGDSGGPVFNRRGRVVGVVWGTDGKEVICVQAGRLHLLLDAAVPAPSVSLASPAPKIESRSLEAVLARTPTPAKPCDGDACECRPPVTRAQPQCLDRLFGGLRQPPPNVIVQPDPEVRRALENIDAKVGVLVQRPRPATVEAVKENEASPLAAGLCMLAAVVGGFVIYFATQK